MEQLRKIQKVGYSTLTVSIPREYSRRVGLKGGDLMVIKEEADGSLRLIPHTNSKQRNKATIRLDLIGELLIEKAIEGCYALGFDVLEISYKDATQAAMLDRCLGIVKRLRGFEVVESDQRKLVVQSFIDPTKFPVDGLIKRLQRLVSESLSRLIQSLNSQRKDAIKLNEIKRISNEIEELYWLIVRQLLVALSKRELASDIGIESPLHASGDRVVAKALVEIGRSIQDIAEYIIEQKETERKLHENQSIVMIANETKDVFEKTMNSFFTPDISTLNESFYSVERLLGTLGDAVKNEDSVSSVRLPVAYLTQIVRYCGIINEISMHRFLRKSNRAVTVQP